MFISLPRTFKFFIDKKRMENVKLGSETKKRKVEEAWGKEKI